MLNYLGPNTGPSTVAGQLPSGAPGTMSAAIPGVTPPGSTGSVSPTGSILPSRPVIPNGPVPPAMAAAIQPGGPSGPGQPPQAPGPGDQQYETLTQSDGTVVLFLKNPDGTRGPAVKIISVKSKPGAGAPQQ